MVTDDILTQAYKMLQNSEIQMSSSKLLGIKTMFNRVLGKTLDLTEMQSMQVKKNLSVCLFDK